MIPIINIFKVLFSKGMNASPLEKIKCQTEFNVHCNYKMCNEINSYNFSNKKSSFNRFFIHSHLYVRDIITRYPRTSLHTLVHTFTSHLYTLLLHTCTHFTYIFIKKNHTLSNWAIIFSSPVIEYSDH